MLSDLSCSTLPLDIPSPSTPYPEEDPLVPLNFDDLLDIAREFEFTRTITHIWPCEEEFSTCPETGLDDILATMVATPNAEVCPVPQLSSAPVHVQEVDLYRPISVCPPPNANASIFRDPVSLPKENEQVLTQTEPSITLTLRGWSPPIGSQFLDLDDSLMFPQPANDMSSSPWLAMFLATSSTQPVCENHVSAIGDMESQMSGIASKPLSTSSIDKRVNGHEEKRVPTPMRPSTRAILEPIRPRSAVQTNSNAPSQVATTSSAKKPKSRLLLPSTSAMAATSTGKYARAPRGGIPPHIARSVTKANTLRVEKERKVMQDAFSNTATKETKKPSVLRRAAKTEGETSKSVGGNGGGKKALDYSENDGKEGRAVKRVRT